MTQLPDMDESDEQKRDAIRSGYQLGADCVGRILHHYPEEKTIDVREEIHAFVEFTYDDSQDRIEMLPYIVYGFRQGTIDWLYQGEDRYLIE